MDKPIKRPELLKKIEWFFVKNKNLIRWVHISAFIIFFVLLALPIFVSEALEHDGAFDHIAIFSKKLIWSVWFPLVFLSVIFSGRSWCGIICPMGAASEWANTHGLKRSVPKWIEWEGTPIVSFIIITIWGQMLGVRDHPEAMAIIFGTTMFAAIIFGFIFGYYKRIWCRHLCPIGLMLGVFSRIGIYSFEPKRPKGRKDKITDKTACPTRILLPNKKESRHCISCFRCVSPNAKGGLFVNLRRPGLEIERISWHSPNFYEIIFLFLATGLSLGGFMWLVLPSYQNLRQAFGNLLIENGFLKLLNTGPAWLVSVHPERREVFLGMDAILISSYMLFWMVSVAALMAGITYIITYMTRKSSSLRFKIRFTEVGYHLIPVAMVSLLIGLGGELFNLIGNNEQSLFVIKLIKITVLILSALWGVRLCNSILALQRVDIEKRRVALAVSALGNFSIAGLWLLAIIN